MPKDKSPQDVEDAFRDELDEPIQHLNPVAPPSGRLIVKRGGHSSTRQIPKPVVLIDTREKPPLNFSSFPNWIAGARRQKLDVGDYSIEGMEDLLVIERKTLSLLSLDTLRAMSSLRQIFYCSDI
jgi:hypothetical protein